jgi:hypothetical protein
MWHRLRCRVDEMDEMDEEEDFSATLEAPDVTEAVSLQHL